MPDKAVRVEQRGSVARLVLDRPETQNEVDFAVAREMAEACGALEGDASVRVVIVTGSGDSFATGNAGLPPSDGVTAAGAVAGLSKPTMAWINGACLDLGLELALACDVRVAAQSATMGIRQVTQGGLPWDGGTQRLPRAVGRAEALRLLLTGEVIDADEALHIGLVQLVGDAASADEMAAAFAAGAPIAAAYAKEAVGAGSEMALGQGVRLEADLNFLLHSTADRAEGLRSFSERRPPHYEGR